MKPRRSCQLLWLLMDRSTLLRTTSLFCFSTGARYYYNYAFNNIGNPRPWLLSVLFRSNGCFFVNCGKIFCCQSFSFSHTLLLDGTLFNHQFSRCFLYQRDGAFHVVIKCLFCLVLANRRSVRKYLICCDRFIYSRYVQYRAGRFIVFLEYCTHRESLHTAW